MIPAPALRASCACVDGPEPGATIALDAERPAAANISRAIEAKSEAARAVAQLRLLVARAGAVINGEVAAQDEVDALFGR